MTRQHFLVYRDRETNTYGVYVQPGVDGSGGSLIKGGFATRIEAETHAEDLRPKPYVTDHAGAYYYARVGNWTCHHAHETPDAAEACALINKRLKARR